MTSQTLIKDNIKAFLAGYGSTVVGFGKIPEDISISETNKSFPRVVVFGYVLSDAVLDTIKDRPSLLYKHHYKTVNWLLDQTAYHLVRYVEAQKARGLAIPASQTVDWENQRGHISHKVLGQAAGLGHIGRSGLLIHPQHGARVRYASVLTDLDFVSDNRSDRTCGDCHNCIAACPAHAISEDGVELSRCLQQLKEFSRTRGIGQYICGVCVKVCDGSH